MTGRKYVTTPRRRKCRACWKNFTPSDLVVVRYHDDRGYPAVERWCPACVPARLDALDSDQRCEVEARRLRLAVVEFFRRHEAAGIPVASEVLS